MLPTTWLPTNTISLDPDPGLFYPTTMMGQKDLNIFPLYGQLKFAGNLDAPLFPTNGMLLAACGMGTDNNVGYGVIGSGSLSSTPAGTGASAAGGPMFLTASAASNATTFTVAAQNLGFTAGASAYALVEMNEIVAITASTGTSLTVTRAALGTTATTHAVNGPASVGNASPGAASASNYLPGYVQPMKGGTTVTASIAASATTASLNAITGFASGDYVQIDVNTATTTAEVRKITLAGSVATFDQPLTFNHAAGVSVLDVSPPFTHIIQPSNVIPSLTLERVTGGYESLQFYGTRVNKMDLKCQATNSETSITADLMAKGASILPTPSSVTVVDESPFVFFEAGVSWFGTPVASMNQVTNLEMSIENGLKDTYTFNQTHTLQFLSSVTRKISGKLDLVWNSFDDATYGYYTKMVNQSNLTQAPTALNFSVSHLTYSQGRIEVIMPKVNIEKYADDVKMEDVVMTSLQYDAAFDMGRGQSIGFVVNSPSQYLTY